MNWLTNWVRPKIQRLVHQPREVPEDLWEKCPDCGQMIFHRELQNNLNVCPHCDFHMRLGPQERLELLFDDGDYQRIERPRTPHDPLRFKDLKRYTDRLKEAREKAGNDEAIVVVHGRMGGIQTVVAVFDFNFLGGSMGAAVGEGLVAAGELACLQEAPLVVVPASGGARMQEGVLSLIQMARTTVAVDKVKERGLPYLVVLTNPTTGGVSASFAMLGDIAMAEPGATIGFAGPRVIEQTVREKLPEGFQRAEYLRDHGMVDMVVSRHALRDVLVRVLGLLMYPQPSGEVLSLPHADLDIPEPGAARGGFDTEPQDTTEGPADS